MKKFQLHISLFLLLSFVFPQANNALHYFVVEHHFHEYNPNEKQFHHNHKTHDCEQSIFKIPNTLLFDFGYTELKKFISFLETEKFVFVSLYTRSLFKNLSDRGPPVIVRNASRSRKDGRKDAAISNLDCFTSFAMTKKNKK